MNTSFHNCIFSFDGAGNPTLYVLANEDYTANSWSLALSIRADSQMEQREQSRFMRLFDSNGNRFCVDSPLKPRVKEVIAERRQNARIIVIRSKDIDALKKKLIEQISSDTAYAIAREKELFSNPMEFEKISKNSAAVEKFERVNKFFVTDALRHHWIHTLTGLFLVPGEKLLVEAGGIPLWAKGLISTVTSSPLTIKLKEE